MLKWWIAEILMCWNAEMFKCWSAEMLQCRHDEMQKKWLKWAENGPCLIFVLANKTDLNIMKILVNTHRDQTYPFAAQLVQTGSWNQLSLLISHLATKPEYWGSGLAGSTLIYIYGWKCWEWRKLGKRVTFCFSFAKNTNNFNLNQVNQSDI